MDAGNMLKPALARGQLRVVGATTLDEYRKHIEKDAALARRFQPVLVGEPSVEDTVAILRGLRDNYEAHHQVRITDEALDAAAELSDRYITDRFLPDKAIDLIDQAGARVRLRIKTPDAGPARAGAPARAARAATGTRRWPPSTTRRPSELRDEINALQGADRPGDRRRPAAVPQVTAADIAEVVSRATGIPVAQLTEEERDRLLRLEEHLHDRVVGQDDAVDAVAEAVRRSRAGLGDPDRPVGSFLFLGPTGVGKTELARSLAEALFGDADRMIRLDMSEFQERHTVSPAGRRAARLRRLRRGRAADRGGAAPAVLGGAARRDREGPPGRVQHPAAGARRRPADRQPGPDGELQEHRADHDQQHRLGHHQRHAAQRRLRRAATDGGRRRTCGSGSTGGCGSSCGPSSSTGSTRSSSSGSWRPSSCARSPSCCWRRPGAGCTRRTSRWRSPTAAVDWLAEHGLPARVRRPAAAPDHPARAGQPAVADAARRPTWRPGRRSTSTWPTAS